MIFCYILIWSRKNLLLWCLLCRERFLHCEKIRRHHMGKCGSTCWVEWSCRHAHTLGRHGHSPSSFPLGLELIFCLLHTLTYSTTTLSKSGYNSGYVAGFTLAGFDHVTYYVLFIHQRMFLSWVWCHFEGGCGMFLLSSVYYEYRWAAGGKSSQSFGASWHGFTKLLHCWRKKT